MNGPWSRQASRVCIISILSFLSGCGSSHDYEELILRAENFHNEGDHSAAIIELKNAILQNSEAGDARRLLANEYLDVGAFKSAEKEFVKAVELGIEPALVQLGLIRSIFGLGDFRRVISESSSIEPGVSDQESASILGIRASAFAELRDFQEAETTANLALEIGENTVEPLIALALASALQRNYDSGLQWTDRALEIAPNSPEAWLIMGQIKLEQGNLEEAEKAFDNSIENRNYPSLDLAKRALTRVYLGKYMGAQQDLHALETAGFGKHFFVKYVSGMNYYKQENYAEAARAFEISKNNGPQYLPREYYHMIALYQIGSYEQARSQAELVLQLAPQSTVAKRLFASVLINESDFESAKSLINNEMATSGEDVVMLRMLGYMALLLGDSALAVEYYERALEVAPNHLATQQNLSLAKLMDGQELDDSWSTSSGEVSVEGGEFQQEFLRLLASFKRNEIEETLKGAQALHAEHPDRTEPLSMLALCYLKLGDWNTARNYINRVLELNPDDQSALVNLARVELELGNIQGARELLQSAVRRRPDSDRLVIALADLEAAIGGESSRILVLEQAMEENSDSEKILIALTEAYGRSGQHDKVLSITEGIPDEERKVSPQILEMRGVAQLRSGSISSAQSTFRQWLKVQPKSAAAYFRYAESLLAAGEIESAESALLEAIKLDPGYLPARVGEIKMLTQNGQREKAGRRIVALREDFGAKQEVIGIEGWYALGTGDFDTAVDRFSTLLQLQQNTENEILYVMSLRGRGEDALAIRSMQDWLAIRPGDLDVSLLLARTYLALEREEEAVDIYSGVLENHPSNVEALNNLAWSTRDLDLKKATELAERAYEISPNDASVMDTLGHIYLEAGDAKRGQELIARAAQLAPNDARIQLHYADMLLKQGRKQEAERILDTLIKAEQANQAVIEEATEIRSRL